MNINTGYDYQKCIGLKVKPRQGDGLLFYSVLPDGKIDKVIFHFRITIKKFSFKQKGNNTHAKT